MMFVANVTEYRPAADSGYGELADFEGPVAGAGADGVLADLWQEARESKLGDCNGGYSRPPR